MSKETHTTKSKRKKWKMPKTQGFSVIEHEWIPMHDGVRLSARLWIPEQASKIPVPAVFEYIPYRKRDSYRSHDSAWGKMLAGHGIAFARVDVRGTGDSEGTIKDEYSIAELEDGVQCIDWLSNQSWCNGNVGMRGISWGAINTLQIAALQPKALKAIMPIAGTDNRFTDDAHYIGGVLGKPNLEWGVLFKTVMAAPPDPDIVGDAWASMWRERLEATVPVITEWIRHQWFDAYWQRGSVAQDYTVIKCPAYLVAGWLDAYMNPVVRLLENLEVPRKGLIGPWGHTYPEMAVPGGLDWGFEEVRWWRHWLVGEDTGIMDEPMFRAFMPYLTAREVLPQPIPGRWISEGVWPPENQTFKKLWLNTDGLGEAAKQIRNITCHSEIPVGLTKPEWLNKLPMAQNIDDMHALIFDTPPLTEDTEILGNSIVNLRISADKPVAFVVVRLTEVSPGGASWLVSYGIQNLTHRGDLAQPEPLLPGQFYAVSVHMHMAAHRFKAGHRVRLAISQGLWPLAWPAPHPAVLKICAGVSSLELPVRSVEAHSQDLPMQQHLGPGKFPPEDVTTVEPDPGGWYIYTNHPAPMEYTDHEIGTTLTRESSEVCKLKPGDPESCSWQSELRVGWQRKAWHCEIVATCKIMASPQFFHIRETLKAYQDTRLVFEHRSDEEVERNLL